MTARLRALCLALAALFLAPAAPAAEDDAPLAVVAGATGRTGAAIVEELLDRGYEVRALVRNAGKARDAFGDRVSIAVADVRDADAVAAGVAGADYVLSAIGTRQWEGPNSPEFVDYGGTRNLAAAAAEAGARQFVMISSGGVTRPDHPLNRLGNVLVWKARGEEALRASGVPYTIVRPGGLREVPGGERRIDFQQGDTVDTTISIADVALVAVEALGRDEALGKSFEIVNAEDAPEHDWAALFSGLEPDGEGEAP